MTARMSQAIQGAGVSILDSRSFSNLTLFIGGEVRTAGVAALRDALLATGLSLSVRSLALLDQYPAMPAEQRVIPFHLVVTFIHNDPDLRIPVPAVPG